MNNRLSEIDFHLRIAREDILVGIRKLFQEEQLNIETMVKTAFENFDIEKTIISQINKDMNETISFAISNYIKYGEGKKIINCYIESHLKNKIESVIKDLIEKEDI